MKRATSTVDPNCRKIGYFNPRPREEGDIFLVTFLGVVCYFNPRPREEGDIIPRRFIFIQTYFNPRPREEGDRFYYTAGL